MQISISTNQTLTTLELRQMVNEARQQAGESVVENRHFLSRVEDELEGELGSRKTFTPATGGTPQGFHTLTLNQAMLVAMRESKAVRRAVVVKLESLQNQVDESAVLINHSQSLAALEVVGRMLNMSEAGKLGMISKYAKANAPHLLPALPVYAIDAPLVADSSPTSSEVAFSATDLLKKFNVGFGARKFNKLAEKAGILESKTRSSTKYPGVGRTYWSVKDLYYGKNITNSANEKETQPYWYECKFEELLSNIQ